MMQDKQEQILELIAAMRQALERLEPATPEGRKELKKALDLLRQVPPVTGSFTEHAHAIGNFLDDLLRTDVASQALLSALAPVVHVLPWDYSYPPRADAPDLQGRIAFAEIIGPEAPLYSSEVCLGLTCIAPRTFYPEHLHPAVELYFVVAGTATWTLDGESKDLAPGSFILHSANAIHAMRTKDETLLAVYVWTGEDVRTTSVYVEK